VKRISTALAAIVAVAAVCEAVPRGLANRSSPRMAGERRWAPGTPDEGKAGYTKNCEACHGAEGKGGTAQGLVPFTLELEELISIVRQGIGVMPGIPRDRISDAEIAAIRDYLIDLEK
jgi:mono/diheme cytochrome c family protein